MENNENTENTKLTPYLSTVAVWALSFGCAVGWGAFVMPGTIFLPAAGPVGSALGLAIGTALMMIIGLNYHYMMKCYPDAGGTFTYTKMELGYDHGFLSAWFLILTYVAIIWANVTALALIIRNLFGGIFQTGFHYTIAGYDIYFGEIVFEIAVLVICISLCIYGKKLAVWTQILFAAVLIAGIIICFGFVVKNGSMAENIQPFFVSDSGVFKQIFKIVMIAPWAFIGFESVSHSAEEFEFPLKSVFLIMAVSLFTGFIGYLFPSFMAAYAQPERYSSWTDYLAQIQNLSGIERMPVFYAVQKSAGHPGLMLLGVVVLSGIITGIIGNSIAAGRLLYSLAGDSIVPGWFKTTHRNGTPKNALLFIMAVSAIIPFFGRTAIEWIVDVTTVGATIAYGYTSAAAFKRAGKEGNALMKRMGAVGIILSVLFCMYLLIPNLWTVSALAPESYLIIAIWSILGFFFFRYVFGRDSERRFGRSSVVWLALLFLIFFTSMMWTRQESVGKTEQTFLISSIIQMIIILIGLFVMFSVYTAMMEREKRLEVARLNAEESSRAKSAFLSNMSHDIRTPMNAIIGYINLSKRDDITMDELKEYLGKIESSSQHLLALINDVLEMSRIESGKMDLEMVAVDLKKVLSEVKDMFATQMEQKNITFSVNSSQIRNSRVLCDKNRLNRVLLNLISNAYKFTPEGGTVSVNVWQIESEDKSKGQYELRVSDSGIGMTEEFAAKVFEAFERERTSTASGIQGTGLGMAITKSIIDLMGGSIKVYTAPNKGTEFVVRIAFDLQEDFEDNTQTEEISEDKENKENKDKNLSVDFSEMRVLLVEDMAINREIATMLLKNLGFTIESAENGQIAVDMVAKSEPGYYDVVLMDIQMPVMDGYDAARGIRKLENEELAQIPIVAMTANAFAEDVKKAHDAGMNGHIAKPIDINNMVSTLQEILSQK